MQELSDKVQVDANSDESSDGKPVQVHKTSVKNHLLRIPMFNCIVSSRDFIGETPVEWKQTAVAILSLVTHSIYISFIKLTSV